MRSLFLIALQLRKLPRFWNRMHKKRRPPARMGLEGAAFCWHNILQGSVVFRPMRDVFSSWIDNGHSELTDPNTIILRITVTDGVLFSHGTRYECTSEYGISLETRNT